jgi:hypothetical protein
VLGALSVSYTTPFVDRPKKDSNVFNVWGKNYETSVVKCKR